MTDDTLEWNPEFFGKPADRIWALQEAAKPGGFCPQAKSVGDLMRGLAGRRLVHEQDRIPIFYITQEGRTELARLLAEANK